MNKAAIEHRWNELNQFLGLDHLVFEDLFTHYTEPHRFYHDIVHILDCLEQMDLVRAEISDTIQLETAIWFHDVIYDPKSRSNEKDSASLAQNHLQASNLSPSKVKEVIDLILLTEQHHSSPSIHSQYMVDIDLSILGRQRSEFQRYERGIRREYEWVPLHLYQEKRTEILVKFLERKNIYLTTPFRKRYEDQAKLNLNWLFSTYNS